MRKRTLLVTLSVILLVAGAITTWSLLGPATAFPNDKYYLYIRTGMNYEQVMDQLKKDTVLKSPFFFNWLATRMDYPQNVKAGKYEIKKDMSLMALMRILRNGRQVPVHLVITKLRTRQNLASLIGRKFECDSAAVVEFTENNDSLQAFGVDSNSFMTLVLPNTYSYFWNTTPSGIFKKIYTAYKAWWTPQRLEQARGLGLTPAEVYILASIVEEETNRQGDKGRIASVYLNRMAKGMKLGADPTIKFAMQNFELKQIYYTYLKTESPYNTYLHAGLPPGPICTPSEQTLDAVLNAPKTDYLYFAAKPDFSGYSNFAKNFKEHLQYSKAFHEAQNRQAAIRAGADSAKTGADPAKPRADSAKSRAGAAKTKADSARKKEDTDRD